MEPSSRRTLISYGLMLAIAAGVLAFILQTGSQLYNVVSTESASLSGISGMSGMAAVQSFGPLPHLLLALTVILVAAKLVGSLFRYCGQPAVMGEIIAGILLGPSLLGRFAPEAASFIMPADLKGILSAIANMGVIIFMFLIGVELDTALLRKKAHASLAISHASIVVPFLLGSLLALAIYPRFAPAGIDFTIFGLFIGIAMSVTAFPVLARILTDLKISQAPLANVTLACAAVDDVTAWCLLALITGIAKSNASQALFAVAGTCLFALVMVTLINQRIAGLAQRTERRGFSNQTMVLVIIGILLCALLTEVIGIHALFGPFLFGALFPKGSVLEREVTRRLENLVVILLLPVFFAYTGMRTEIGLVNTWENWLWCLAITLVATLGKMGGATLAARFTGISWRPATAIGVLMNTRGLMELIVLNIGLDMGILSPLLFTMFVIMAVVTTLATSPLFVLLTRSAPWTPSPAKTTGGVTREPSAQRMAEGSSMP